MPFFDSLRAALSRYSNYVHTVGKQASPAQLTKAAERLGFPLPPAHLDFLQSWNGATLFHEAFELFAADKLQRTGPTHEYIYIGDSPDGALWEKADGRVYLVDAESPDPILCGSDLEHYVTVLVAREALVMDREGEFRDVFSEEGELNESVRLKRALAGQKHDPKAALYWFEHAELLCEEGDPTEACALLKKAVGLDGQAGPAWELLSALLKQDGQPEGAEHAAVQGALATWDPFVRASRYLDAAQLMPTRATEHAQAANAADPDHAKQLVEEAKQLLAEGHVDEAERLATRLRLFLSPRSEASASHDSKPATSELQDLERELRTRHALRVM